MLATAFFSPRWLWAAALLLCGAWLPATAGDWPEWRGAGRRGVWSEDGILERFPEGGLRYAWRTPIGEGHAGPAVAGRRVFVADFIREEGIRGAERALCLDEETGEPLWTHSWKVDYSGTEPTWADGPRATPTVDGGRVYFIGGMGRLVALEAATGRVVWQHDLVERYRASVPTWGVASAPLVDGPLLIALVGGEEGAGVVAFDKATGEEKWRSLPTGGDPGYAPPLIVQAGGVRQLIIWHPKALAALDPASGKALWEHPLETRMGLTVATPVFDRGRLLVSAFFDGSTLLQLDAEKPRAEILWRRRGASEQPADTEALHALIATPVIDGDHIYGVGSYGEARALRAKDGERLWESLELIGEHARWAAGLIVRQGDRYWINTDRGDLVIAELTPEGYREIDRTPLIEPTSRGGGRRDKGAVSWTHPAYANRHVVVRNDREIVRASLGAQGP